MAWMLLFRWCDCPRYCVCYWSRRPSWLMICLRSRSAASSIACTTQWATVSDASKIDGKIFNGNIYYCKILYRYHNRFAFESETFTSFQLSFCSILWNILAWFVHKVDIDHSVNCWKNGLSTGINPVFHLAISNIELRNAVLRERHVALQERYVAFLIFRKHHAPSIYCDISFNTA